MLKIKKGRKDDISIILSFIKELATYERLADQVVANEASLEKYLFSSVPAAECLIAEFNSEPVGFALFFTNFSTFIAKPGLYLEDLFVKPEFRGKGIGKKLLLEIVNIAKIRNYGRVDWAVLDWNEPAINFYKSLGAVPQDEWTVYRLEENQFNTLNED